MISKIKQTINLVSLLLIILAIAFTHIAVDYQMHREEERQFVKGIYYTAYGIYQNLDYYVNGPEHAKSVSISGASSYLYNFHSYLFIPDGYLQYNKIHKKKIFFDYTGYHKILRFQDKLNELLDKALDENMLTEEDMTELKKINDALEKWCNSFVDEDGNFRKTAFKKEYFEANFTEFIDTVLPR